MACWLAAASTLLGTAQSGAEEFSEQRYANEAPLDAIWPALSEPQFGDLDQMLERGEIRVLTTFTLGSYYIERGQQRGTVYEMSRRLESLARERLGAKARHLRVTIIPVRRDQLLPNLIAGHGDVVFANLTVTPGRVQAVDFSRPFSTKVRELLVTAPGIDAIESVEDLAGREVMVPIASSYFESLLALNESFAANGMEPVSIVATDPRFEIEDLIELMAADLIPITVADAHRMKVWGQVFPTVTVHDNIVLRDNASNALAMRKNSPQLKALLDEFVHANRVGTLVTNMLIKQYTEYTGWARAALSRQHTDELAELAEHFQSYGSQYEIDWLMLASFALQESGFDQAARSPAGAVGVMQVLPSTAADRRVAIDDIELLENNVHAGTKYLSILRGHYFSDDNLAPTEQMLFTMAGYNAGPNRINRLRREAAARGLDPNVWFNNVELVVAAKVGREPVQYVGNIYRYYITYKRAQFANLSKE